MLGAIAGDIIGSRFEWDDWKSKLFDLWGDDSIPRPDCQYTDDTVLTVAVADALMHCEDPNDDELFRAALIERFHYHGEKRINAGFGPRFYKWLKNGETGSYGSYGNGSAMRVSPVGWYAQSLEEAEHLAAITAEITHSHIEAVEGSQATAAAIWLARHGSSMDEIRSYVEAKYYPIELKQTLDDIRPTYEYSVKCIDTVPVSLLSFFESTDFEDAIRNAVSVGGDTDTIACITGSIAEAYYGISDEIAEKALSFLDNEMKEVVTCFVGSFCDPGRPITELTFRFYEDSKEDEVIGRFNTKGYDIPVNISIDNAEKHRLICGDTYRLYLNGWGRNTDIYEDESAFAEQYGHMAVPSLIPIGTFPNDSKDGGTPRILFVGTVNQVDRLDDSDDDGPNYCLEIETLDMTFHLFLLHEGEIKPGNVIHGEAWLYGLVE